MEKSVLVPFDKYQRLILGRNGERGERRDSVPQLKGKQRPAAFDTVSKGTRKKNEHRPLPPGKRDMKWIAF